MHPPWETIKINCGGQESSGPTRWPPVHLQFVIRHTHVIVCTSIFDVVPRALRAETFAFYTSRFACAVFYAFLPSSFLPSRLCRHPFALYETATISSFSPFSFSFTYFFLFFPPGRILTFGFSITHDRSQVFKQLFELGASWIYQSITKAVFFRILPIFLSSVLKYHRLVKRYIHFVVPLPPKKNGKILRVKRIRIPTLPLVYYFPFSRLFYFSFSTRPLACSVSRAFEARAGNFKKRKMRGEESERAMCAEQIAKAERERERERESFQHVGCAHYEHLQSAPGRDPLTRTCA